MKFFFFSILLCTAKVPVAQSNLIANPGFEEQTDCPQTLGQVDLAVGWSSFGVTPDYYSECAQEFVGVPQNLIGNQNAFEGSSYFGLVSLSVVPEVREFFGCKLAVPMIVGIRYFASFNVSLADSAFYDCPSNKIGIKFSTVPYSENNPPPIDNVSQVYSTSVLSDKTNWTKISGSFVADSSYSYAIIGNFFNFSQIDTAGCGEYFYESYYYVDQICVSTDSLSCISIEDGLAGTGGDLISVLPNPSSSQIVIRFPGNGINSIDVMNLLGQRAMETEMVEANTTQVVLSMGDLPPAEYIIVLHGSEKDFVEKVITIE